MRFLINCSNLKAGGGLQVADSICGQLNNFENHYFVVVLSSFMEPTGDRIGNYKNVEVVFYNIQNTFKTIFLGRDTFLDLLVNQKSVDAVLTVFGPSRWTPRVPHLSGFALPQLVIPESPFFVRMQFAQRVRWKLWCNIRKWSIKRSADWFWTENPYISKRLSRLFKTENVFTISNYYNQVYDTPNNWKRTIKLPSFNGVTCLSISAPTAHKNFGIIEDVIHYLRKHHPEFNVRFVLTFDEKQWPFPEDVSDSLLYVGKLDVSEGPFLYEQSDIMFMPTLLECFTATYPEAMRMGVPIVTTDLEFARGLCGNAACYYNPIQASDAAEAIYKVGTDKEYSKQLVENGKKQLLSFGDYNQRAKRLILLLENIVSRTL